jgi:hypothetical protein
MARKNAHKFAKRQKELKKAKKKQEKREKKLAKKEENQTSEPAGQEDSGVEGFEQKQATPLDPDPSQI